MAHCPRPSAGRVVFCVAVLLGLLLLRSAVALAGAPVSERVIGGTPVPSGSWGAMAGLEFGADTAQTYCGGTLIAPRWVLTAAHCPDPTYVGLGRLDLAATATGEQIPVSQVYRHPSFTTDVTPRYDFQLVELATASQQPTMRLATAQQSPPDGATVMVAGWGQTGAATPTTMLQQAALRVVSNASCQTTWRAYFASATMLCAGYDPAGAPKDTCNGDSGGPLTYVPAGTATPVLAGLTSWGGATCAAAGVPGVYARVSAGRAWITEQIGPVAASSVSTLDLGSASVATTGGVQDVQVQSRGAAPLNVTSVGVTADAVIAHDDCTAAAALPKGTACTIGVALAPQAPGARSATLTILTNGYDPRLTVGLTGTGVATTPVASPGPPPTPVPEPEPEPPSPAVTPQAAPADAPTIAGQGTLRGAVAITLSAGAQHLASVAKAGSVAVRCRLAAAGTCAVTATISAHDARRLHLAVPRGAARVTVAAGTAHLVKAGTVTVTLRLTAAARRQLRRTHAALRLRLAGTATGADGRHAVATVAATLAR